MCKACKGGSRKLYYSEEEYIIFLAVILIRRQNSFCAILQNFVRSVKKMFTVSFGEPSSIKTYSHASDGDGR